MHGMPTSFSLVACVALLTLAPLAGASGLYGATVPEVTTAATADGNAQPPVRATADLAPTAHVVPGLGVAATASVLEGARGGTGGDASADLRGTVTGNSATSVATGSNTIQPSSFAGASGIPIVIQNTGANVLIQNATVINLQFQ